MILNVLSSCVNRSLLNPAFFRNLLNSCGGRRLYGLVGTYTISISRSLIETSSFDMRENVVWPVHFNNVGVSPISLTFPIEGLKLCISFVSFIITRFAPRSRIKCILSVSVIKESGCVFNSDGGTIGEFCDNVDTILFVH